MYNPDIKSVYYEYVGIPMSDKERLEQLENAFNFIARNALYGMNPVSTLSLEEEPEPTVDPAIKAIGTYLAFQIISAKLDIQETLQNYPQCQEVIKSVLAENGIQI